MMFAYIAEQMAHAKGFDTEMRGDRLHFYQERFGESGFDLYDAGSCIVTEGRISAHAFKLITGIEIAA